MYYSSFMWVEKLFTIKIEGRLPRWSRGWGSICQCRGHGFNSWSEKTLGAAGELSLFTTTTEALSLKVCAPQERHYNEKPRHHNEQ